MENMTKEQLHFFNKRTIRLLTVNGGLLRNKDCAFYMALSDEPLLAFGEKIRSSIPEENCEFSTVGFEVPDLSYYSLLFDKNYPGFMIVDHDYFVPAELLYEKREDVIEKVRKVYSDDNLFYVALSEDSKAINEPIGDTHVVISFFTDENKAKEVSEIGACGEHIIERWILDPPNDTTVFSLDGEIVYGYEIAEGTWNAWLEYVGDMDNLKAILDGRKLHILAADDNSGAIMRCLGMPIFFSNAQALKEFAVVNQDEMTHTFYDMTVEKKEGINIVLDGCEFAFIDDEIGRHVFHRDDLLRYFEGAGDSSENFCKAGDNECSWKNESADESANHLYDEVMYDDVVRNAHKLPESDKYHYLASYNDMTLDDKIKDLTDCIKRVSLSINGSKEDEQRIKQIKEYESRIEMCFAFKTYFEKQEADYMKFFGHKQSVPHSDDFNQDLFISEPDEEGWAQWQPRIQAENVDWEEIEKELGFKINKTLKIYWGTVSFAAIEGMFNGIMLYFDPVNFRENLIRTIYSAHNVALTVYPNSQVLCLGTADIDGDDGYTLYIDNKTGKVFCNEVDRNTTVEISDSLTQIIKNMTA